MATAVLDRPGISLSKEEYLLGKEKKLPKTEKNIFEKLAKHYQSLGYNAVAVYENPDDLDLSKYLSEETLKYLDTIDLDEN